MPKDEEFVTVYLGNDAAVNTEPDGDGGTRRVRAGHLAKTRTTVRLPRQGWTHDEHVTAVTDAADGVWKNHSEAAAPLWVASDDSELADAIAARFGGVEVRKPLPQGERDEFDEHGVLTGALKGAGGNRSSRRAAKKASRSTTSLLLPALAMLVLARTMLALKTNAGSDFQAAVMGARGSQPAAGDYVALTANTTAPAAGDTTLTAEITTAGGGLIRKQGTYAHTAGTNTYTITPVFTANGTDSLPVTIGKYGVFNASSAGTLVFETLVSPTATLSASGDQLTITITVTM